MYYLENHGNIHENAGKSQQISGISQSFFSGEVEVMEVLRNPAGFLMHPGQVPEFIFAFLHVKKIGVFHILKVTVDGQNPAPVGNYWGV
jgi:hypothetical protein